MNFVSISLISYRWFCRNGAQGGDISGDKHYYSGEDLPVFLLVSSIC